MRNGGSQNGEWQFLPAPVGQESTVLSRDPLSVRPVLSRRPGFDLAVAATQARYWARIHRADAPRQPWWWTLVRLMPLTCPAQVWRQPQAWKAGLPYRAELTGDLTRPVDASAD